MYLKGIIHVIPFFVAVITTSYKYLIFYTTLVTDGLSVDFMIQKKSFISNSTNEVN